LVIVEERILNSGIEAEIVAVVSDKAFYYLDSSTKRVASFDYPIPYSSIFYDTVIPDEQMIIEIIKETLKRFSYKKFKNLYKNTLQLQKICYNDFNFKLFF